TMVRSAVGDTSAFSISVGLHQWLHQGSALSLFAIFVDELTKYVQEDVPWCMLFANNIVLVDDTKEGVNAKLELWREALESRGFRISRTKTEYMECNFSKTQHPQTQVVSLDGQQLEKSAHFRYLGSMFQAEGEIDVDVTHRVKAGWAKWRSASGVLCDTRMPLRLKGKFYRTAVRLAILCGTECWVIKTQQTNKMKVAEMRMLRWMCGKTRKDRIRNEKIREMVQVAPIEDKIRENRLIWFGHVQRRPLDAPVRKSDTIDIIGHPRGRGRPKLTLVELIRKDMSLGGLTTEMTLDRKEWRKKIHVADPT
ncbi:hypothetical protein, partial [Bartonella sp. AC134YNZD]|uniref:hypothetical protein n=1 Tax=Bartonella sp. AC134YNZD TaxID=3243446 RepID=UPI0035CF065D